MTSRFNARVENLAGRSSAHRSYVVHLRDGETEEEAFLRTGACGPVIIVPEECATTEEWFAKYAPEDLP